MERRKEAVGHQFIMGMEVKSGALCSVCGKAIGEEDGAGECAREGCPLGVVHAACFPAVKANCVSASKKKVKPGKPHSNPLSIESKLSEIPESLCASNSFSPRQTNLSGDSGKHYIFLSSMSLLTPGYRAYTDLSIEDDCG